MQGQKPSIREAITAQIISALESGDIPPWRQPWVQGGLPLNAVSGRRYSGVNILQLHFHMMRHHLPSKFFATFRQWNEMGFRVRPRPKNVLPGQWACEIIYYRVIEKTETTDDGNERLVRYPILRTYRVFSASQVTGPSVDRFHPEAAFDGFGPAEDTILKSGADIRFGGDSAFWAPPSPDGTGDYICCPTKDRFRSVNDYYATIFHELAHWSQPRLGWHGSYAEAELRAEIASAFTLSELGVPQSQDISNCKAYVASWITALRNDPSYILTASKNASRVCDFLLSFSPNHMVKADIPEEEEVPF